jgi:hypothetical protein
MSKANVLTNNGESFGGSYCKFVWCLSGGDKGSSGVKKASNTMMASVTSDAIARRLRRKRRQASFPRDTPLVGSVVGLSEADVLLLVVMRIGVGDASHIKIAI